ncbi:exodeoxyribonuclease VII small subunit [Candidatus Phycorickettsia trachydisci]|uniref:Exodeoxyribonuclease 7 small subunit n=1 Tax=Candidatus Phycorickettsia trachydisci TaxID=2115978 RepID=A0A2P1PA92_9RICK|nr:exodeoxyribonuclease VII small subunit [Candidatus Phycorickettsia trachydisci]AVP88170.1 exodeoxyribonuclease VII small subunit [Candidatus Phycorickettsia trachydisci]
MTPKQKETDLVKEIESMTYEAAFIELENIVKNINSGSQNLDSVVKSLERAFALAKHCQTKLNSAKLDIRKMVQDYEGNTSTQEVTNL